MIEIRGLEKRFNSGHKSVVALNNIHLQISKGEFALIKGSSGCGKSTLLFCMGGLLKPSSGTIRVSGKDLYSMSEQEKLTFRVRKMGMVYQSYHLLPYFNVAENIRISSRLDGVSFREDELMTMAKRLKIDHRLSHQPSELSVGEKQRVCLARTLILKPEIILADEPTGNLDPENSTVVLQCLNEFKREGGTVVMVTHGTEADLFATRQIEMNNGKVI
ncbi:MAG: ABC transporter ATP-binding protein [Marinifilum sp.]|jgi:ABC-type lipoprotein export system ATPase subunit|nr:ABC transporter ATP-binding protein [Marinifilum sp.]